MLHIYLLFVCYFQIKLCINGNTIAESGHLTLKTKYDNDRAW